MIGCGSVNRFPLLFPSNALFLSVTSSRPLSQTFASRMSYHVPFVEEELQKLDKKQLIALVQKMQGTDPKKKKKKDRPLDFRKYGQRHVAFKVH